jgi:putative DNA primase/helicase
MDRSIILELRRKLPHESVDRIRYAETGLFYELCQKLARFANDNSARVRLERPDLPHSLNDRQQDNWEPLLAIATVAGGSWHNIAIAAALKLSGGESLSLSIGTELLADIQEIFERKKIDRISSVDLIKELCADDEKPWATYNKGFQIKPRQIASRLKGYDIHSKTIRISFGETPKGYEISQFKEAFLRYIPLTPPVSATPPQTSIQAALNVADNPPRCGSVADVKSCEPLQIASCGAVADGTPILTSDVIDMTGIDFEVVT